MLRHGTESATQGGQRSSGRGGEAATRRGRERDCSGEAQATCVGRLCTRASEHAPPPCCCEAAARAGAVGPRCSCPPFACATGPRSNKKSSPPHQEAEHAVTRSSRRERTGPTTAATGEHVGDATTNRCASTSHAVTSQQATPPPLRSNAHVGAATSLCAPSSREEVPGWNGGPPQ